MKSDKDEHLRKDDLNNWQRLRQWNTISENIGYTLK